MTCPDASRLREHAENADPAVARHVAACDACRRLVELARREEAAIRAALALDPPADLLERTRAALDASEPRARVPSRRARTARGRPRSRPATALALTVAVALALVVALVVALRGREAPPAPPVAPPPPPVPLAPPPPPPPAARPTPPPPPPENTPVVPEASDHEEAPPLPDDPPVVVRPDPPAPVPAPAPATRVEEAVAVLRKGRVTVGGKALAVDAAVPAGALLQNGGAVAELEATGRARVIVAPNARLVVRRSGDAAELFLERGQLLARTLPDATGRWLVATGEGRATPAGTRFLVATDGKTTRIVTAEGQVTAENDRGATLVGAGFEVDLVRAREPGLSRPASLAKALAWVPEEARGVLAGPVEVLRSFDFEAGAGGFQAGRPAAPGAHGSRGCLEGVPAKTDYARYVELEELKPSGVLALDPDLWVEATVRVDRSDGGRTRVVIQAWDPERKENLAHFAVVEANAWTSVAAPLRSFTDASGRPRAKGVGPGHASCFDVFAGDPGESLTLRVDDVRFFRRR